MIAWPRWLFRRGKRGVLLLNMRPGDRIVSMTTYRDWLVAVSEQGELYMITDNVFADPADTAGVVVHRDRLRR